MKVQPKNNTFFGNSDKCLATILPTLFDSSQRRCRCKLELNNEVVEVVVGESGRFFFSDACSLEVSVHQGNTDCFD